MPSLFLLKARYCEVRSNDALFIRIYLFSCARHRRAQVEALSFEEGWVRFLLLIFQHNPPVHGIKLAFNTNLVKFRWHVFHVDQLMLFGNRYFGQ